MLFHALDKITDKDSNDQLFKGRNEKKLGSLLGFSTTPGSVFRSQVKAAQSKWTETRVHTQPAIIQLWVCFCLGDTALCPICWVIKPALLIKSFTLQGGKQRTTQADWADTHTHTTMHIYSLVYVYLKYKATKVAFAVSAGRKMKYCWFFLKAKKMLMK